MPNLRTTLIVLLAVTLLATIAACVIRQPQAMTPSITYLHLLRHTPFFTELESDQLRRVIRHSREWEVSPHATIVTSAHPEEGRGYWVLLDGGWELRLKGQVYASGHDDAGKWFNPALLGDDDFELVASAHSYVMHITAADMDDMLAGGYRFGRHLDAGRTFYRALVTTAQKADAAP
jgi:hypothetical protein